MRIAIVDDRREDRNRLAALLRLQSVWPEPQTVVTMQFASGEGFLAAHSTQRAKRLRRLYGGMYFHMPDGEVVPLSFEQVAAEYVKGQQGKYADRRVSLWFPYWRVNEDGLLDTAFGLEIDLTGYDDPDGLLPRLKKGDFIYVTGRVQAKSRNYFRIDRVEEIRRQETRP